MVHPLDELTNFTLYIQELSKITNIKAYMITALYNATTTINHFYQQEVNHDMYGGGWCKKDII